MKKYIDAQEFKENFLEESKYASDLLDAFGYAMHKTKVAEVRPITYAHWKYVETESFLNSTAVYKCSNCGATDIHHKSDEINYCWHCGRTMVKC